MRRILIVVIAALSVGAGTATAQSPSFQMGSLIEACSRGNCVRAAAGVVRELRRDTHSGEALDAQFGYVALAVYHAARSSEDRRNIAQVAVVLRGLSRLSTQDQQKSIFRDVSRALLRGDREIFEHENPFAASPSVQRPADRRKITQARRAALVSALNARRAERLRLQNGHENRG